MEGDAGLVHQHGTQNRGEPEEPRLVAALIGLDSARQLAIQLIFERVSGVKIPRLQTVIGADDPIAVADVLVFTVFGGNAEELLPRTADAGTRIGSDAGTGNVVVAIR